MSDGLSIAILALIACGLLVVVVLLIYLLGRLNQVEQQTQDVATRLLNTKSPATVGPFGGLSGKKLWDVVIGKPLPDVTEEQVQAARDHFPAVLQRQIVLTFEEGVADGKKGITGNPKNPRAIQTLRGKVDSWLPTPQLQVIYQCGTDLAQGKAPTDGALQQSLDMACQELHERAGIPADVDYVQMLLGLGPEDLASAQNTQTTG